MRPKISHFGFQKRAHTGWERRKKRKEEEEEEEAKKGMDYRICMENAMIEYGSVCMDISGSISKVS